MKKILLIIATFLITFSVSAQSEKDIKAAEKISKEMNKVLSLGKKKTKKIKKITLARLAALQKAKDSGADKAAKKESQAPYYAQIRKVIGEENQRKWGKYRKAQNKKKKKH